MLSIIFWFSGHKQNYGELKSQFPAQQNFRPKKSGWVGPPVEDKTLDASEIKDSLHHAVDGYNDISSASAESRQRHAKLVFSPLATHLPDQVVKCDHSKSFPHMNRFQAGILFLDISGKNSMEP